MPPDVRPGELSVNPICILVGFEAVRYENALPDMAGCANWCSRYCVRAVKKQTDNTRRTAPRIPVRRNGMATKSRIIEAAIDLIADDGETLTVRKLAKRANCSPAAIYQFFADLDDLGSAIIQQVVHDASKQLEPRLSPVLAADNPVAFFAALIEGVIELQSSRPETLCLGRAQPAGPRAALAEALRDMIRALVSRAFAAAMPHVAAHQREEVLTIAQHGLIGAMVAVPPRDSPGRSRYLAGVADFVGGYVSRALTGDVA